MPTRIQDRQSTQKRTRDQLRWQTIISTLDEEIPPYSLVSVLSVDNDGNQYVGKVVEDGDKLILVTWEHSIPAEGSGEGTNDWPWWVEYDTADGTPARGEKWGPAQDEFKAKKNKDGLFAIPMKDGAAPPTVGEQSLVYLGLEYCRP